jgi:hypothetical protein
MTAMPVCDPEMPLSFRTWAVTQRPIFSARGELAALIPGGSSGRVRPVTVVCWLLAGVCMIALSLNPLTVSRYGCVAADAVAAITAVVMQHRSRCRDLRLCRRMVIFAENLDEPCGNLLTRTQAALGTILGSQVRAAGLLLNDVPERVLREHEWQIASRLGEITDRRSLLGENTPSAPPGPMTSHVLAALQQAVELAQQAVAARVAALERYARQVAVADNADRDWRQAVELSKLNDRFLDLIARTTADEYATCQLAGLTEQLATATAARNDRLHEADLAAEVLVLPRDQN